MPVKLLPMDRWGKKITISDDLKKWSASKTIRDVIVAFADALSPEWWEKIVVSRNNVPIPDDVRIGDLANDGRKATLTFESVAVEYSELDYWSYYNSLCPDLLAQGAEFQATIDFWIAEAVATA